MIELTCNELKSCLTGIKYREKEISVVWEYSEEYVRLVEQKNLRDPFISVGIFSTLPDQERRRPRARLLKKYKRETGDANPKFARVLGYPEPVIIGFQIATWSPKMSVTTYLMGQLLKRLPTRKTKIVPKDTFADEDPCDVPIHFVQTSSVLLPSTMPGVRGFQHLMRYECDTWCFLPASDAQTVELFWNTVVPSLLFGIVPTREDIDAAVAAGTVPPAEVIETIAPDEFVD